jgi:hypothetical protein
VSCFELRGGGVTPLIAFLCAGAIVLGLALGPRRVLAAWRRARGARSAFALGVPFAAMQAWPIERLRQEMRLPARPAD